MGGVLLAAQRNLQTFHFYFKALFPYQDATLGYDV